MAVLNEWAFIGVFFSIAWIFPFLPILGAHLLAPHKPNSIKQSTYECGVETVGDTWVQFKVQYYIYGLIFLVFDIEVIFLYPWAVIGKLLGPFAFYAMAFFLVALLVGFAYVWKKGGLEWE